MKRRAEDDKDSKEYELNHLRTRVAYEVKENEVRQAQHARAMLKQKEENSQLVADLNEKISNL